jgi:signal transduction histidine kinase
VRGDSTQLEQVLSNLVANACDAMPNGGTVSIETGVVTLDARSAREWAGLDAGTFVRVVVRDTGAGMDDVTRGRAFEPFFTTKPPGAAMGLGLAVVHGIVHRHGGAITVESEVGRGSTFSVFLPALPRSTRGDAAGSLRTN